MPNAHGRKTLQIPPDVVAVIVDAQRRIKEETGFDMSWGLVARYLIKLGYAAKTQHAVSDVSSAVNADER